MLLKTFDLESFEQIQKYLHEEFGMEIVGKDGRPLTPEEIKTHFPDPPQLAKPASDERIGHYRKEDLASLSNEQLWKFIGHRYLPSLSVPVHQL
jgi:hypothetical protein